MRNEGDCAYCVTEVTTENFHIRELLINKEKLFLLMNNFRGDEKAIFMSLISLSSIKLYRYFITEYDMFNKQTKYN